MWIELLLIAVGFTILVVGADLLVRGARNIALALGISTLIVGLTVVAFGTSAPELFVSLTAAIEGSADVAVGNVIGSNLFNVLMIIGITALIAPVRIAPSIVRRDMPVMLLALGLFVIFSMNLTIGRIEGAVLFLGIVGYLWASYKVVTRDNDPTVQAEVLEELEVDEVETKQTGKNILLILAGLVGLVVGAELIVDNAILVAREFGVSELVIGVTLVAIGTSLPELATTVVAAYQGEPDLAVGNAVGSNIFNVLCVVALTALVAPLKVDPAALEFDMVYMFFACLIVWPIMFRFRRINRATGGLMVALYVGYILAVIFFGKVAPDVG